MKVLILDDKAEERERAQKAAIELGLEPVVLDPKEMTHHNMTYRWMTLIPTVDLVTTDLMWEVREGHGEKVNGLLVVILAKHFNVPVGICANGRHFDRGHHGPAISFINDSFIAGIETAMWIICGEDKDKMNLLKSRPPFVWSTHKDWNGVMSKLLGQVSS